MANTERVKEAVARAGLDAVLLMDDRDIYYATGFLPTDSAAIIERTCRALEDGNYVLRRMSDLSRNARGVMVEEHLISPELSAKDSAAVLAGVPHVQGRVEVIPTPGKDYTILIDYAHTPDSMVNVLRTVKEFAKGRTVAVFGCGGDRDRTKRPLMGKAAADWSDFAVVTTDNPRTEQPEAIIEEILPGFAGSATPYQVVVDRVEAIHWAMDHAQKEDVIVLCGKGHETYQEINHKKYHMDEREIVADYLKSGH